MEQLTFLPETFPNTVTRSRVREMPTTEQPVNRIREFGPLALSTTELIACIIGTKDLTQALAVYQHFDGSFPRFSRAEFHDFASIHGIGPATAARLSAVMEFARRAATERPGPDYQIRSPGDAANLLMAKIQDLPQETFHVLCLDTRNRVIKAQHLYTGSINTSLVRIAEVFKLANALHSTGIIVAHNHPSGDPTPSPEDIALTRRLVNAGKILEIDVLDHIVIGCNRWISLRERGLGFEEA
jgi:DNA repair protein RadC